MPDQTDSNLIQMFCDGECTPEQCAHVERILADDPEARRRVQRQMEFNGKLRDCLCGVTTKASRSAPPELLAKVRGTLDQANPMARRPSQRRSPWAAIFEDPRRGNIFAIAATILLVAGAVLYGIFGRSIDDVGAKSPGDV